MRVSFSGRGISQSAALRTESADILKSRHHAARDTTGYNIAGAKGRYLLVGPDIAYRNRFVTAVCESDVGVLEANVKTITQSTLHISSTTKASIRRYSSLTSSSYCHLVNLGFDGAVRT